MRFFPVIFVFLTTFSDVIAVRIGTIRNASLIMDYSNQTINASTCDECLCTMLNFVGNFSILSFNCYQNQNSGVRCQLFTSTTYLISSFYRMENNSNSTFYFQQLPSETSTTMNYIISTAVATTMLATTTTTTITPAPSRVQWSFDSNTNDLYNVYNGSLKNGATYASPGYNGYGSSLALNSNLSQYVLVSAYKNMTYTSFTWEMWVYPTNLDNMYNFILGMCQVLNQSFCLYIMISNSPATPTPVPYFAFFNNDCVGNTTIPLNQWHHLAYVYDYSLMTQYVYWNGLISCTHSNSMPFLASQGQITIGAFIIGTNGTPWSFWSGLIDEISYISQAKNAPDILSDATLVAYYSFDNANSSYFDSGPNKINGTSVGVTSIVGRVGNGIRFSSAGVYFQATGFTLLGTSGRPYSIAIWIKKTSGNGTIIHLSSRKDGSGGNCFPMLGLTSSNQIIGQSWNGTLVTITGPVLPINNWTHLSTSYSPSNGLRLWVNGNLTNSSKPFNYTVSLSSTTITVGTLLHNATSCKSGPINVGQFYGEMDEFRIYSRELNATDVYLPANP